MKRLAAICIDRPVFASMIVLALVVTGAASYFRLGIDRFPRVDLPQIAVRTSLPNASVEETEVRISQPIEEAVNTVEGITELRSVTGSGTSNVFAVFDLDRNIDVAAQDVRDRIGPVMRELPDQTLEPFVAKSNADDAEALSIAVAGNLSVRELTEIADKIVRPRIERSSGVGEVSMFGGLERAINIWVDAARLAAHKLPISEVQNALERQNQDAPGGNVTSGATERILRTTGRITNPEDFNDLVIRTVNGVPLKVRDIGWAEDGTKEQRSLARLNGVPTVVLEVRGQIGANTIEVIESVKANMARAEAELPPGIRLEIIRDQSRYIEAALHEIDKHLVLGSILACLVVFAFMRSWRSTVIAAVAIPASVITTFGMMDALDFTLNSVTMLALVLMVGIVIDDAIVVLENIFRFVEEKQLSSFEAARQATAEIALPVLATTLCLVVIFIPVSFMSSISGKFLYQFGFTAAVAILVSLLVSFTLTPMMSARMFRRQPVTGGGHASSRMGFYRHVDRLYTGALTWSLGHKGVVAVVAILVIASAYPFYRLVRQEFIPTDIDEAEFQLQVTAPEGTSTAAMDDILRAIDGDVRKVPGVQTVLSTTGGGFLAQVNSGNAYVRIAPHAERTFSLTRLVAGIVRLDPMSAFRDNYSQRQIMQRVRQVLRTYPDLRTSVRNIQSFNIGGGGNSEFDFVIRGPELAKLSEFGEALRARAPELGLIDADITLKIDKPELRVVIDRARAADLGVSTADIGAALRVMVGGNQEVSSYRDPELNEEYDVQVRLDEKFRDDPAVIQRLYVPRSNGELVRLDSLVSIVNATGPSRVDRIDRQRQVSLRAGIAPGYGLADRIEAARAAAAELGMPPAYSVSVVGRGRELERTFVEFGWAFLLSIVFMYIVLAAQYESIAHPLVILLSLPLSLPFALFSLWASGNTLNLYSALGMLVLFGVVAKNAILQVDHARNLRAQGVELSTAVLQASRDRLRPILMTTLALVGGMLPLVVGSGPGAEERRAIAVVVIGGQTLALFLTLIVTPIAFHIVESVRARRAVHSAVEATA
ncbi:MAG TPA: efflux RND transporter permease subunit [Vicinamibacterales bacterium]|nr:efflux RND transporter permease subunit [Vicinamibacterales bacterium]